MLDDVEGGRLLVEPAREDALPAALRVAHVELDERPGQRLDLPGRRGLAGAQPDDRVPDPDGLARLEGERARDSVALVEKPEHRHALGHRSRPGSDGGHGLGDVDGPRLSDRLPVALGFLFGAPVAAGERGREDENRAERKPHAWSGVQAS
jgi:hypothetical protein